MVYLRQAQLFLEKLCRMIISRKHHIICRAHDKICRAHDIFSGAHHICTHRPSLDYIFRRKTTQCLKMRYLLIKCDLHCNKPRDQPVAAKEERQISA